MPEAIIDEAADPTYMEIAQLRFTLAQPGTSASAKDEAKTKLAAHIDKFGAPRRRPTSSRRASSSARRRSRRPRARRRGRLSHYGSQPSPRRQPRLR